MTSLFLVSKKIILFLSLIIILIIAAANILENEIAITDPNNLENEIAITVGNYLYLPLEITLIILAMWSLWIHRSRSVHMASWMAFLGFSVSWMAANSIWTYYELVLEIEPFPSTADILYLIGYPFLLMFLILYIEPAYNGITKKMIVISVLVSVIVLIPSVILLADLGSSNELENSLSAAYPIADAIVIIPSVIGVFLFFGGRVNFLMATVFIGISLSYIGDIFFMYLEKMEMYYTGHPIEIFFYLSYVFLIFGVLYNILLFRDSDSNNDDLDD